jgi:hypothetical protein
MRPTALSRGNGVTVASPPFRAVWRFPMLNRRALGLLAFSALALAFLTYMVRNVPVDAPRLTPEEAHRHWAAAVTGALIVLTGVLLVVVETLKMRRLESGRTSADEPALAVASTRLPLVPRSLGFQRVPRRALAIAGLISLSAVAVVALLGLPLWNAGLAFLLPWIPLLALEAKWKYAQYGIFAAFAGLVLLQVLHMGEHSMQVGQLAFSQGDLARSHGVFGQLDFELVHFVTDTVLWLCLGMLLIIFRGRNPWLWVAFAAASLHQVEHFYLFWIYNTDEAFYSQGGFAGIMGRGGMIGTPLYRPYLHFTYNLIVIVPMALAVWDEARKVDARA